MALTPAQRARLARGGSSKTDGRGASVNARLLAHGGYRGAVGGGNRNAKPATKAERAKWVAGAQKKRLIPGAKAKARRFAVASGAAAGAAIGTRRYRRAG